MKRPPAIGEAGMTTESAMKARTGWDVDVERGVGRVGLSASSATVQAADERRSPSLSERADPWGGEADAADAMAWASVPIAPLIEGFGRALGAGRVHEADRLREEALAAVTMQADDSTALRRGLDGLLREEFLGRCAAGTGSRAVSMAAVLRGRPDLLVAGLARAVGAGHLRVARGVLAALPEGEAAGLAEVIAAVALRLQEHDAARAASHALNAWESSTPNGGATARGASTKAEAERRAWRELAADGTRRLARDPAQRQEAMGLAVALEPTCPGLMAAFAQATEQRLRGKVRA